MPRLFTPEEANRTLPLVRSIVSDILACGREIRERSGEDAAEINDLRERLGELLAELHRIGCTYKDWGFEHGLVDFPARIGGEDALLCWRSDEPSITHYHGVDAGYAGRRPLPCSVVDPAALRQPGPEVRNPEGIERPEEVGSP